MKRELLEDVGRDKLSEAGKRGNEIRWGKSGLAKTAKGDKHNTQKELAKELGWSKGKVKSKKNSNETVVSKPYMQFFSCELKGSFYMLVNISHRKLHIIKPHGGKSL